MKRKYYVTSGFEDIKINDYLRKVEKKRDIFNYSEFEFHKKIYFTNLKEARSAYSACVRQCKHVLLNNYEYCEIWLNVLEYNEIEDDWDYLDPIKIDTFYKLNDVVKKLN